LGVTGAALAVPPVAFGAAAVPPVAFGAAAVPPVALGAAAVPPAASDFACSLSFAASEAAAACLACGIACVGASGVLPTLGGLGLSATSQTATNAIVAARTMSSGRESWSMVGVSARHRARVTGGSQA